MEIGIWLPVYGGWLRTRERSIGPDVASCLAIAQQGEALGYDFLYVSENLLNCIHGPRVSVIDAWSMVSVLSATTTRIGLCGAVKPGFRPPLLVARMIETCTKVARRPIAINIVCGWWKDEFELADVDWLDHAGRYRRADAFLRSLNRLFHPGMVSATAEEILENAPFGRSDEEGEKSSYGLPPRSYPTIWISGHSQQAARLNGEWGDCIFLNGIEGADLERQIAEARQAAAKWGRSITVALNAFVIATETRAQAEERREHVLRRRNDETIAFFRGAMEVSRAAAWARLSDEQMVDSNAGLSAGLVGSFEDVQERLKQLESIGVNKIVCQFDDPMRDVGPFMARVVRPLRGEMFA